MRTTERHTFFWTARDCFSNWYPARFTLDGISFCHVEQAMMHAKAMTFGDAVRAQQILATSDAKAIKALGRQVSPFHPAVWDEVGESAVFRALHAKFTQNPPLLERLLATAGTELVEASPYDTIWGIGMKETDPGVDDPANWRGIPGKNNKLGRLLTRLRHDLLLKQTLEEDLPPAPVRSRVHIRL